MSSENANKARFEKLKEKTCSRVPLVREVLADLDTPLSTYLKLANTPYSYLFESVQGGEKWGRYSIIGLPCRKVVKINNRQITIEEEGVVVSDEHVDDPLAWISDFQNQYARDDSEFEDLPRFTGGLVGYFGYETIRYIEPRLDHEDKIDPLGTPDILLMVSEEVVVFDNLAGKLYIIVHVDPQQDSALSNGEQRLQAQTAYGLLCPKRLRMQLARLMRLILFQALPKKVINPLSPKLNNTLSMAILCRWCCRRD